MKWDKERFPNFIDWWNKFLKNDFEKEVKKMEKDGKIKKLDDSYPNFIKEFGEHPEEFLKKFSMKKLKMIFCDLFEKEWNDLGKCFNERVWWKDKKDKEELIENIVFEGVDDDYLIKIVRKYLN